MCLFICRIELEIPDFSLVKSTHFYLSLSRLFNTQVNQSRELSKETHTDTKRERESVLKRRNTTTTTSMGWLKRAASSVKSAMGFGDDDDGEDDGDGYRDCDDGSSSSRRRSNKSSSSSSSKKKEQQQKVRYPVLQFAQSPITGEFIGGVQGLSWFCESLRENGEGDVAHEFRREDEETAGKEPSRRVKSGTFFPIRVKDGNVEMFRRNS